MPVGHLNVPQWRVSEEILSSRPTHRRRRYLGRRSSHASQAAKISRLSPFGIAISRAARSLSRRHSIPCESRRVLPHSSRARGLNNPGLKVSPDRADWLRTPPKTTRDIDALRTLAASDKATMSEAVQRKPKFGRLPIPKVFTDSGKRHDSEDQVSASLSDTATDTLKVHDYSRLNIRGDSADKYTPPTRKKNVLKQPHCSKCQRMVELSGNPKPKPPQDEREQKNNKPAPDDKLLCRGANPRTGVVSPSEMSQESPANSSRSSPTPHSAANKQKPGPHGERGKSPIQVKPTTPPQVSGIDGAIPNSTAGSHPSISPMSGRGGLKNGWQDQFVVNMPSAREPSPPTMSLQQILEFQQSIGKVHHAGDRILDPDPVPGPITQSNETSRSTTAKRVQASIVSKQSESRRKGSLVEADSASSIATRRAGQFYNADDVGQNRSKATHESSSGRLKAETRGANKDGSFLGCLDANRPELRNPDEILLFHNLAQDSTVAQSAPSRSKKRAEETSRKREKPATPAGEEKKAVQEEWRPISQNLKLAQCSKPSPKTLCQQPRRKQNGQGKENAIPTPSPTPPRQRSKVDKPKDDNVSTTIPTTTRTMKTTGAAELMDKDGPDVPQRPPRTPGNVRAKVRIKTPPRPETASVQESRSVPTSTVPSPVPTSPVVTPIEPSEVQPPKTAEVRNTRGSTRTPADTKATTDEPSVAEDSPLRPPASDAPGRGADPSTKRHQAPESTKTSHVRSSSYTRPISSLDLGNKGKRKGNSGLRLISTTGFVELDGRQGESFFYSVPHVSTADIPRAGEVAIDCRSPSEQQTLSLLFDILLLSAGQLQGLFWSCTTNRHGKFALGKVVHMAEHCVQVFRRILVIFSIYKKTGSWVVVPDEEDPIHFVTDIAEAVVYLVILGLILTILGRAAGYLVLVGSWVIWFMKPFGWLFAKVGGALVG